MEVSKVNFTEETRQKLQNPMLDRKKRQELRRRLALELIKSKPNGSAFSTREFTQACFPKGHPNVNVLRFVKQMQRDGLIDIEPVPNSYKYIITMNDAKTIVAPRAKPVKPLWKDAEKPEPSEQQTIKLPPNKVLGDYAKEFAWEHNSDSLREFILWMDGKELDLRRLADQGTL